MRGASLIWGDGQIATEDGQIAGRDGQIYRSYRQTVRITLLGIDYILNNDIPFLFV
jgi:hypothetical protein